MNFADARDATVLLFGLFVQVPYIRGEGEFVYPLSAILMATTWEAATWDGHRSLVVIGMVIVVCLLAAAIRLLSHRKIITLDVFYPTRVAITSTALFALAFVPTIVIVALRSR